MNQSSNRQMLLPHITGKADQRAARVARWENLVRSVLPSMATANRWPISLDHCFMRVCLDTAVGASWHTVVERPAIRHLSDQQLAAAIAVAEGVLLAPETLHALNQQSINWRKRG